MSKDNHKQDHDKTQEIIQHYQNTLKNLIKGKGLNHQSLEKHLSNMMNQLSNEMRKMTGDLLKEVNEKKDCSCPGCGRETWINAAKAGKRS